VIFFDPFWNLDLLLRAHSEEACRLYFAPFRIFLRILVDKRQNRLDLGYFDVAAVLAA
jgi:hypothetical protein